MDNLLPIYVYDPRTQQYTLVLGGLGAVRQEENQPDNGSGEGIGPSGPGNAFTDAFGHPTELGVSFGVGAQNFGNALAPVSNFSPTLGFVGQVSSNIGNSIMGTQVSPVANPVAPTETSIAPNQTIGLAAMNAAETAEDTSTTSAPGVTSSVSAAAEAADDAGIDSNAGMGTADNSSSDGNSDGGSDGVSDAAADAADAADASDADAGGSGDGDGDFYNGGRVSRYANGGLAAYGAPMNSANFMNEIRYQDGGMAQTAQMMANQGRMGDNMMVHMNPMEVAGLQALARSQGTSMTTNPSTGMPEAFSLKAFLPAIAGLALGPAGLGLTAAQAGLATGAAGTLATGSLKKGLMAGLGAYGGAGLGEGLIGAGGPTPATVTTPGGDVSLASNYTGPTPTTTLPSGDISLAPSYTGPGSNLAGAPGSPAPIFSADTSGALPSNLAKTGADMAPITSSGAPQMAPMAGPQAEPFANMPGKDIFKYGYSALAGSSGFAQPEPGEQGYTPYARPQYRYSYETGKYERLPDKVMAGGGLAAFKQGGKAKKRSLTGPAPYDFQGRDETLLQSVEKNFAKGGRFLVGDGDGMSDDIPAVIADKQPARLADGEFVIPADVVSHLGNGSSKAGAEKLHEMMNRIRKERTGREKQAPAVKANKYMPA